MKSKFHSMLRMAYEIRNLKDPGKVDGSIERLKLGSNPELFPGFNLPMGAEKLSPS